MGRRKVYHRGLTYPFENVSEQNKELFNNFINYEETVDKSKNTVALYSNVLKIFFSWNYEHNHDKFFIDLKSRDFVNFISYLRKDLESSPKRIGSYMAALNMLSNYIERMYEDEYPTFRNRIRNIERIPETPVLEKTVITEEKLQEMLADLVSKKRYQLACWLSLLASSGCRRSEMIQMKVSWFDESHEVFPEYFKMYKTDKMRTKGRGTKGKQISRYVIKETFKPYLDLWLEERQRLNISDESLFVVKYNQIYHAIDIAGADCFARTLSNYYDINFYNHCMRHYFTTKLRAMKFPDEIITDLIQWESVDMIKTYDDTSKEKRLEDFFVNLEV